MQQVTVTSTDPQTQVTEVLSQAKNVGYETAGKVSERVMYEASTFIQAMEVIAHDQEFQEALTEIAGIGIRTVESIVNLAVDIVTGTITIVADVGKAIKVVFQDYVKVRKGDLKLDIQEN